MARFIDLDVLLNRLHQTNEEYVYDILDEIEVIEIPDDYILFVEELIKRCKGEEN